MTQKEGERSEIEIILLKNGAEEAKPLVIATMLSLRTLLVEHPLAFYEFVMKCRDREYKFFGNNAGVLERFNLIQPDESVHGSLRNIVLSAVEGEELDMRLGSPLPETS